MRSVNETQGIELDGYSLAELRRLAEQVQQRIRRVERDAVAEARRQIEEIARQVGVPLKDLIAMKPGKGRAGRGLYVNPAMPGQHWNGLGRKPKWVKDWVDAGKPLEELRA